MATFGLKVAGGVGKPGLLSEVFKGAFGDPELTAKLALMSSQIWGQEHQNKLYDASTEKARQEAAKTQQELAILQAQQAAKDAAGPAYGQTLADAIHNPDMPVPVIHTPPAAQSLIGPGMPYISPDQKAAYDAGVTAAEDQRKAQRLLGPAIVQMGTSAADLAKGTGVGSGNAILLGNPTPAEARTGAILSTGNLPSKDTVVTAGDYAGTDAATREAVQTAAGKLPYDKALEQTKGEVATKQAIDIAAGTLPYDKDLEKAKADYAAQQAVDTAKGKLPYDIELEKAKAAAAAQQAVDTAKGKLPYDIELEKAKAAAAAQQAVDTAAGKLPYDKALEQTKGDVATKQAIDIAKGKLPSDIALENAKIDEKAKVDAANNPLGTAGSGPAAVLNAKLKAKKATSSLTPEEEQLLLNTQATLDHDNAVTPGKDAPIYMPDGKGGYTRVGGADPNAVAPAYPGDSVSATDSNILLEVALNMAMGRPITPEKAQQYVLAFDRSWPEKPTVIKLPDGSIQRIEPTPAPAGWPTKEAVRAAANLQGKAPLPDAAASILGVPSGVIPASALTAQTTGELSPLNKTAPTVSVEQGRDQAFASMMQQPALDMNDIGINDLPSLSQAAQIIKSTAATNGTPSLFGAGLELASRDVLLDPASRAYEQAVALWTSDSLYKLSGAAISPPEWVRQQLSMVPMYGDTPEILLRKARDRSNFLRVTAKQGWSNDPASYKSFVDQTRLQGLELDYPIGALPPIHGPAAGEPRLIRNKGLVAPVATPAPAPVPAPGPGQPAIVAPTTPPPKAPDVRPQGYENLSDDQWQAMFDKLPPNIQLQYRKLAGEDVSGGQ